MTDFKQFWGGLNLHWNKIFPELPKTIWSNSTSYWRKPTPLMLHLSVRMTHLCTWDDSYKFSTVHVPNIKMVIIFMYMLESTGTNDYYSLDKKVRLGLVGLNARFHALPPPPTTPQSIGPRDMKPCTDSNSLHVRWARRTAWRRWNKPHISWYWILYVFSLMARPAGPQLDPVEVGDFRRITDRFRGMYRIYLKRMKATPEDVNM